MTSPARLRWLDQGLVVLAEEGAAGLRIDRLAARLQLSKGSFHHHFDGADGYQAALLEHYEKRSVGTLPAVIEQHRLEGPRALLERLTVLTGPEASALYDLRLDVAVRAWATSDPQVADVLARIDATRLSALESVWRSMSSSPEEVRASALLPYLVYLGATVLMPQPDAAQLRAVYDILLRLVPEAPDH